MDAMRMCALALTMQFASTLLMGVADAATGKVWSTRGKFFSLLDQGARAALLFAAAGCFHRVVASEGGDMQHLLRGMGREEGIGLLFYRMQKIAIGFSMYKTFASFWPYVTRTALYHNLYNKVTSLVLRILPNTISNLVAKFI